MGAPVSWKQVVRALEQEKGERWKEFWSRYGDWGRDAALWLGRRLGRLKLTKLAELADDIHYAATGTAVARFGKWPKHEPEPNRRVQRVQANL